MSAISTTADFLRPDYLEIDPHITANRKAFLRSVWNAVAPELELQYGVYNSTVAAPTAIFSQAIIDSIELWRKHTQIAQLIEDAADNGGIDYEYLELFLENYRIRRTAGEQSVGLVKLIYRTNTAHVISPMNTFTAKGITFTPTAVFNISPSERLSYAPRDQRLQALDDGTFSAVIEMRSDTVSVNANLTAGTVLVPEGGSIPGLLEATVLDTFVGGVLEDTLSTLVPQLVNGITSPVMTSRANISAQIRSLPEITVRDISVIGAGDIESVRDKHGLFAISQGGRGDIYVRTADILHTKTLTKTCELIEIIDSNTAKYRCFLSRDEAPAAYSVIAVNSEVSSRNLDIAYESRSIDLNGVQYAPDVINYTEGAFSAFQTILFDFIDNNMSRHGAVENFPDVAEYAVTYEFQPNITEIQDHCVNRSNVSVMGDLLVKAAIPCKTSISFSIAVQQGQTPPDRDAVVSMVVNTVNSTGFMNVLPSSIIIEAVQKMLPEGMFISNFSMVGSLLLPTMVDDEGAIIVLRRTAAAAKEELYFEVEPYATANTICFFADSNNVNVVFEPYKSVARLVNS